MSVAEQTLSGRHGLTTFLSYRRRDAQEVRDLERATRIRGARTWRDVNDLHLGGATEGEILDAISSKTEAFILYASKHLYETDSTFIWDKELPAADRRWRAGGYPLVVLYRGTTPDKLSSWCGERGLTDFAKAANGQWVPLREDPDQSRSSLQRAFRVAANGLLATLLAQHSSGSAAVVLRTFSMSDPPDDLLLDLDWTGVLEHTSASDWEEELFPALRDFTEQIARAGISDITLYPHARLTLCVAFGMALPLASRVKVRLVGRDGDWEQRPGPPPLLITSRRDAAGEPSRAVVTLGLSREVDGALPDLLSELRPRHTLVVEKPTMPLEKQTRPIAQQIGDELRALASSGVRDFHLVLASPAPLAVAIGRQLHALGRVSLYYADEERRPRLAFTLRV